MKIELPGMGAPLQEDPGTVRARARDRSLLVSALVFMAYGVLVLRAIPLMLLPDARLQEKAAVQFQKAVEVETPRGDILSRDGGLLATSVEMPSLFADPSRLPPGGVDALASDLADLLGVDRDVLARRLAQRKRRSVVIAHRVSPDLIGRAMALDPGGVLYKEENWVRYYPSRSLAAQVLGAVGWNNAGIAGVERSLNDTLRGTTYKVVRDQDRRGRALTPGFSLRDRAPAGDTVVLTIDRYIQQVAEEALDQIVERSKPLTATAVVMDVQTGEILALANRPTINLNKPSRDTSLLQNYAVSYAYEPGSVMKPFVVASAIDRGLTAPGRKMDCEGGRWKVGRSIINDDHPHDVITVSEVIKYSSNICSAKLGFALGAENLMAGLRRFGFASRTGVSLFGEAPGGLRRADTIKPIELATTTFGQGMTANVIQLTAAVAALGNGGARMQPYLVSEIRDRRGNVKRSTRPQRVEQAVSPETAEAMLAMMETVLGPDGTGKRARIPGYTAAGKTGTAQKVVDGRYSPSARVATFMGVAPAVNPRVAIVVLTDTPTEGSRYGGTVSGPAFSYIGERVLRYLGVPEDRALDEDEEPPVVEEEVAAAPPPELPPALLWVDGEELMLPSLEGLSMRDALVTLDGAGLRLAFAGSGVVVSQSPAPGERVRPGDRVEVTLQ